MEKDEEEKNGIANFISAQTKREKKLPWVCFAHPKEHDKFFWSLSLNGEEKNSIKFHG